MRSVAQAADPLRGLWSPYRGSAIRCAHKGHSGGPTAWCMGCRRWIADRSVTCKLALPHPSLASDPQLSWNRWDSPPTLISARNPMSKEEQVVLKLYEAIQANDAAAAAECYRDDAKYRDIAF